MTSAPPPRKSLAQWLMLGFFVFNIALFSSLGVWQLQRLGWKKDLIERIETRTRAEPTPAPLAGQWDGLTGENAEYRHIALEGLLLRDQEVAVYTSTDLGAGYWVMAPLLVGAKTAETSAENSAETPAENTADNTTANAATPPQAIVWINRGFVPTALRQRDSRPEAPSAPVQITGMLRLPDQPHPFLRANVPQEDRWYRRVPEEFTAARPLLGTLGVPTAPYFVHARTATTDADAPPPATVSPSLRDMGYTTVADDQRIWPRPDMPLAQLRNNHLGYALTWFALALMNVAALVFFIRAGRRPRREDDDL